MQFCMALRKLSEFHFIVHVAQNCTKLYEIVCESVMVWFADAGPQAPRRPAGPAWALRLPAASCSPATLVLPWGL